MTVKKFLINSNGFFRPFHPRKAISHDPENGAREPRLADSAQEWAAAFDSFYDRCEGKNLSPGSIRFYRDKLAAFSKWLEREGHRDGSLNSVKTDRDAV